MADDENGHMLFVAANLMCGFAAAILTFVCLTVVPDCVFGVRRQNVSSQLHAQLLIFFVTQLLVHLILLVLETSYVTFLLASNTATFIDDSLQNVPGNFVLMALPTSAALQLFASIQRSLSVIWPDLYHLVGTKPVTFLIVLGSFLFGANCFIRHYGEKRTLVYNLHNLRWLFNTPFRDGATYTFLAVSGVLLGALCLIAVTEISLNVFPPIKHAHFVLPDVDYDAPAERARRALGVIAWFLSDALYFATLAYANKRAMPPVASRYRAVDQSTLNYYDGLIQTYALGILPALIGILNLEPLRRALGFRMRLMVGGQPAAMHPQYSYATYSSPSSPTYGAAIPMFKFSTHQRPSIVSFKGGGGGCGAGDE